MSETAINDYLTKQITVNKNIVTFRLLSRALSIHVNAAKLALHKFHEASKSMPDMRIHAAFFLSGDAQPTKYGGDSPMETDVQECALEGPSALAESVPVRQFLIVPEENLEGAKRKFTKLDDIHYYSLAPSPIRDPALLVTATDAVRKMDSTRTPQDLQKLGVAVDLTIKVNQIIKARPKPPAEPTVPPTESSKAGPSNAKPEPLKMKPELKPEPPKPIWPPKKDAPNDVPKPKGGLDWSKARPKGAEPAKSKEPIKAKELTKEKEKGRPGAPAKPRPLDITFTDKGKRKFTALMDLGDEEEDDPPQRPSKPEPEVKIETKEPVIDRGANAKVGPPKRGIKRPTPPSDDEDEGVVQPPKNRPRLSGPQASACARNGRILSDDEEGSEPVVKKKRIQRHRKSEVAMLWSDDEAGIVDARRSTTPERKPPTRETSPEPTADEGEDIEMQGQEDICMEEEPVQRRPRKIKKEWPVGRNGLRKRRTEKERTSTDDKGYMAVETYSEYESVASESEEPSPEEVKKAGRKIKGTKKGKGKEKTPKTSTEEESAAESSEVKAKPGSGSAPMKEVPKEEERKPTLAPASKPPPKAIKSVPAGKRGQKTLNAFFGKK